MTAMSDSRLDGVTPSDFVLTYQHHKIADWDSHYLDYASFLQLILRIQMHATGTRTDGHDILPLPVATTPATNPTAALHAPLISAADDPPSSAAVGSRWSGRCQPSDFDDFLKSEVRQLGTTEGTGVCVLKLEASVVAKMCGYDVCFF
jgi:hypothetical protein